ncbi:MAG: YkgJ family cysteine cluster protein [Acidobacteriota bacterium]|nr:YkgJ family cysteine cluster protein [Blastocatellia bacterium]MDW8241395.1 YkgJ family cysteine cluster protein [Acidobacteriota bacterium]
MSALGTNTSTLSTDTNALSKGTSTLSTDTSAVNVKNEPSSKTIPPRLLQLVKRQRMSERTFEQMLRLLSDRRHGVVAHDEQLGFYAESLAESWLTSSESQVPDCLTCGACCAYLHQVPVLISDPTPRRLTWQVWDANDRAGAKSYWLRRDPHDGQCIALDGQVGERVRCTIYPLRPQSCRAFEAGSDRCHAVRRMYGLEPPLSETEQQQLARVGADHAFDQQAEALQQLERAGFAHQADTLTVLCELIQYNQAKVTDIVNELGRLAETLTAAGCPQESARCSRAQQRLLRDTEQLAKAAGHLLQVNLNHRASDEDELKTQLLEVGLAWQRLLEKATKKLAERAERAFVALNLSVRDEDATASRQDTERRDGGCQE